MRKLFRYLIIICSCVLCFSCINGGIEHNAEDCELCNSQKNYKIERMYKSHDYAIEKVTINDTLIYHIMVRFSHNGHTHGGINTVGMIKLD